MEDLFFFKNIFNIWEYKQHGEETCIDTDEQSIAPYQFLTKRFMRKLTVHHNQ